MFLFFKASSINITFETIGYKRYFPLLPLRFLAGKITGIKPSKKKTLFIWSHFVFIDLNVVFIQKIDFKVYSFKLY